MKHHDGFCMWKSRFTDFDMKATPFNRDIVGEVARACAKVEMKYGIYYSQRDWHHRDYGPKNMARYNQYMRDQNRELPTRPSPDDACGCPNPPRRCHRFFRLDSAPDPLDRRFLRVVISIP